MLRLQRFYPRVVTQNGFAVATAGLVVPHLYLGEAIPSPNYLTIRTGGILTGDLPLVPPGEPVVILEREGEHHELPAIAYPVAGFAGAEMVGFSIPQCFAGEYQLSVSFGGYASNAGLVRFRSSCQILLRPERVPRSRRPSS